MCHLNEKSAWRMNKGRWTPRRILVDVIMPQTYIILTMWEKNVINVTNIKLHYINRKTNHEFDHRYTFIYTVKHICLSYISRELWSKDDMWQLFSYCTMQNMFATDNTWYIMQNKTGKEQKMNLDMRYHSKTFQVIWKKRISGLYK